MTDKFEIDNTSLSKIIHSISTISGEIQWVEMRLPIDSAERKKLALIRKHIGKNISNAFSIIDLLKTINNPEDDMKNDVNFINPIIDFEEEDYPIFVFLDDMRGFMGWLIKSHSKGNWNHVMMLHRNGYLATQTNTYKELPITAYMKPNIRLKFWKYRNLPELKKEAIKHKIQADLSEPGWRRRYDYIGIIGQALSRIHPIFRKINVPWTRYCSERVAGYVRMLPIKIKNHPTPSEINEVFKADKENMELIGYYQED